MEWKGMLSGYKLGTWTTAAIWMISVLVNVSAGRFAGIEEIKWNFMRWFCTCSHFEAWCSEARIFF